MSLDSLRLPTWTLGYSTVPVPFRVRPPTHPDLTAHVLVTSDHPPPWPRRHEAPCRRRESFYPKSPIHSHHVRPPTLRDVPSDHPPTKFGEVALVPQGPRRQTKRILTCVCVECASTYLKDTSNSCTGSPPIGGVQKHRCIHLPRQHMGSIKDGWTVQGGVWSRVRAHTHLPWDQWERSKDACAVFLHSGRPPRPAHSSFVPVRPSDESASRRLPLPRAAPPSLRGKGCTSYSGDTSTLVLVLELVPAQRQANLPTS